MRVLILGDVHGHHQRLADVLRCAQTNYRIGAAIQVGDFGFYEDAMMRLREEKIRFPVPLHTIDGNHEDHRWLRRTLLRGAMRDWEKEANLIYQPRPSVARLGASTIGFIGGALHVDRPQQHNLLSRFPNYILRYHREQAVALFNREKPDLIVTHSCPAGIGIGVRSSPHLEYEISENVVRAGFDPGPPDDCGEMELTKLWKALRYRPHGWVFGHFHCPHDVVVEGTRFVCVGNDLDATQQMLVLWDTEERKLLTVRL